MSNFKINLLRQNDNCLAIGDLVEELVVKSSSIKTDSRCLQSGEVFVPIVGEAYDGHDFIFDSLDKGASCFLYESKYKNQLNIEQMRKGIEVNSTLKAFGELASISLKNAKNLKKVIAITGSVGKTTVKNFVHTIISETFRCSSSTRSYNNEIGLPQTILSVKEADEFLVLEMGARHKGDIKYLCEISNPDVVCALNAKESHLSEFGSLKNIIDTKSEILFHCDQDAVVCVDKNQPEIFQNAKNSKRKMITYSSQDSDSDVTLDSFEYDEEKGLTELSIKTPDDYLSVELEQYHDSIGINSTAAVSICLGAGLSSRQIEKGLCKIQSEKGRFFFYKFPQIEMTVIDDSYNASPTSMIAGARSVRKISGKKSIGIILGDMLELGEESLKLHQETITEVCQILDPDLFVYVGQYREVAETCFKKSCSRKHGQDRFYSSDNVDDLFEGEGLLSIIKSVDLLYLKASNSMKFAKIIERLKQFA